ncbi:hypothetical protein M2137_002154 [Parabacteroides sp. PFB2-10]|uniref:hypothetical protein n=1 Tax=Parabacteroides sp. PFB2-10 TaxID=1742405 RepID=UPI0024744A72|nr:hypothetical protein [Parabacteroides sp. PFB2-10]MDH6313364.1 hypothetical protein [Parabacteroides sp. PFB2-10]
MKRFFFFLLCLSIMAPAWAQKEGFSYKFYGFVRGDIFYNSRANVAPVDGNFYMYPLDIQKDANGEDLNATPNGSFYTFTTRLGIDLTGPRLGKALTSAKIETDFGGFSPSTTMLRIRQAYVALDWEKSQLLIGQTWHPLSGAVMPDVLNLSSGAPFNPFNRSPMLRLQHKVNSVKLTAATIWQLQYLSAGPAGASEDYIKNSCIPEVYVGADHTSQHWLVGVGAHLISLKPRTASTKEGHIYKVDERVTGVTAEAHLKYSKDLFTFAAKSLLGSMTDHSAMLGGYGVHASDSRTGEQTYTPFRRSTSWVNFTYGAKWKAGLFVGYSKNLGTTKSLIASSPLYGKGLDIDQLFMINPSISYNLGYWKLGIEYCLSTAYYGSVEAKTGKVLDTHSVSNHRALGLLVYTF